MSDHDRLVSIEVPLSDAYLLIGTLKEKCSEFHSKAHDSSDDDLKIECRKMGDDCDARAENVRAQVHSIKPQPKYWSNQGACTDQRNSSGNSSITQVESSKLLPWLMMTCVLSAMALSFALFASASAWWSAKEFKQVQVQLMYSNAIMLREGLVKPGDMVYGPEGNLEYKNHQLKKQE